MHNKLLCHWNNKCSWSRHEFLETEIKTIEKRIVRKMRWTLHAFPIFIHFQLNLISDMELDENQPIQVEWTWIKLFLMRNYFKSLESIQIKIKWIAAKDTWNWQLITWYWRIYFNFKLFHSILFFFIQYRRRFSIFRNKYSIYLFQKMLSLGIKTISIPVFTSKKPFRR